MSFAQVTVGFESADHGVTGVYDTWEESPFRTGRLEGNVAVVDNCVASDVNPSSKVLAVQRSRYGSNTFGAFVALKEYFGLSSVAKYVNLMVHRPYSGRVMVIGLGKRTDRPGQSAMTEQFWALSDSDVPADSWQRLSLPVKGNEGVVIHYLVIVPDCESPHDYVDDKICYIDEISVTDVPLDVSGSSSAAVSASDFCVVNTANRNGEVVASDGGKLENYRVKVGTTFEVRAVPAPGFVCTGLIVRSGDKVVNINKEDGNRFLIPSSCMLGNVVVEGIFVEKR